MIRVYGASDDLVVIEGSKYKEREIDCFDSDVRITFSDGTVIRVGYGKPCGAVWYIDIEKSGTKFGIVTECNDEDAEIYSDICEIDAEVLSHEIISHDAEREGATK